MGSWVLGWTAGGLLRGLGALRMDPPRSLVLDGSEGWFAIFAALGHRMARNGPFMFCNVCGAFWAQRLGPKLRSICVPPTTGVLPAGPRRALDNILEGLHPKTGEPF